MCQALGITDIIHRIQHLSAHHTVRTAGTHQHPQRLQTRVSGQHGSLQNQSVGRRLEGVSRQYCQGLTVNLVVGGFTPAEIVIIHAGQVIMDQRIRVDQLQCAAKGQRQVPVNAAQPGKLQRQHRSDPLSAAQDRISHSVIQLAIGHLFGKQTVQIPLDSLLIFLVSYFVIHIIPHLKNCFPQGYRQAPSST